MFGSGALEVGMAVGASIFSLGPLMSGKIKKPSSSVLFWPEFSLYFKMKNMNVDFILCGVQYLKEKTCEKIRPEVPHFIISFSSFLKDWLQYDADTLVVHSDSF